MFVFDFFLLVDAGDNGVYELGNTKSNVIGSIWPLVYVPSRVQSTSCLTDDAVDYFLEEMGRV